MLIPKGGITLNTENVGTLISRLRKEKGMTQQELADKLQLTDKAVSKWERGGVHLDKDTTSIPR